MRFSAFTSQEYLAYVNVEIEKRFRSLSAVYRAFKKAGDLVLAAVVIKGLLKTDTVCPDQNKNDFWAAQ